MSTTVTQARPADTLRRLADHLDALPHARISPPEIFRAMNTVAEGRERQSALNLLSRHLRHAPGFEQWLYHWTGPQSRVEVVALVRAAAEQAEAPPEFRPCYEHGYVDCGCPEQAGAVSRG